MRWLVAAVACSLLFSGCASTKTDDSSSGSDATTEGSGTSASGSGTASSSSVAPLAGTTGNRAPSITAFSTNVTKANATSGVAPLKIKFTFNATDLDNDNLTYTLTFGVAKANVTGKMGKAGGNATYAYATKGNYTAKLIVTDGKLTVNKTLLVKVTAAATTASAAVCAAPPAALTFTGSGDATHKFPVTCVSKKITITLTWGPVAGLQDLDLFVANPKGAVDSSESFNAPAGLPNKEEVVVTDAKQLAVLGEWSAQVVEFLAASAPHTVKVTFE